MEYFIIETSVLDPSFWSGSANPICVPNKDLKSKKYDFFVIYILKSLLLKKSWKVSNIGVNYEC